MRYMGTAELLHERAYFGLEIAANDEEIIRVEINEYSRLINKRLQPYGIRLLEENGDYVIFEAREIRAFVTVAYNLWMQTSDDSFAELLDAFLDCIGICWCED